MALLTSEQLTALKSLSQRERIEVILNVLVRHLERQSYRKAFAVALTAVESSDTKEQAIANIKRGLAQREQGRKGVTEWRTSA